MSVASMARFGLSALASVGIVLGQLAGSAGLARAQDFEDPWFEEAVMTGLGSVHPTIVAPSPTPEGFKPAEEYKPTDSRRIVFDAKSFQVGETVKIQHLGFRPGERIVEWTYRYVPGCPNNQCWERVYEDLYVTDRRGSMTFPWDTSKAEPGRYRFCTGGIEGCRSRYAELELTSVPQKPAGRTR
jgi:hypothetical protein